jgi:M6 family metalloprotease-like protein
MCKFVFLLHIEYHNYLYFMRIYFLAFFAGVSFLLASNAYAVPAVPWPVEKTQPDGTKITVYLKGDEYIHWMESLDGYTLMYDSNKNIVYAEQNTKGDIVPSKVKFTEQVSDFSSIKEFKKGLRYSRSQVDLLKQIWKIDNAETQNVSGLQKAPAPVTGDKKALCILVGFSGTPFSKTIAEFEELMNQTGYSANGARGSVQDFYLENSYNQMKLTVSVVGIYNLPKTAEYYAEHVHEFADAVAKMADADVDYTEFANPNNALETFHIIYAGHGDEAIDDGKQIWAHKSAIPTITLDGVKISVYSCSPELRGSNGSTITTIGVICHELCHVFGAPDFYDADDDTGGKFVGTGYWDLMAGGSWNGSGASPAHINMYQKIQLGWVDPVVLDDPQTVRNMPNSAQNFVAYQINTPISGEYYILENRQKVGFDSYIPGNGLLIYHVSITGRDISTNTVNNTHPQKMYPVCASSNVTIPNSTPSSYGTINSAGCPFPGASKKTAFSDYTAPAAFTWSNTKIFKPLTDIQEQNGLISFRFLLPEVEPISQLNVSVNNQSVQLEWGKPGEDVTGYNVYRNNQLVIKLLGKNNTTYTQNQVNAGIYSYCVTAIYENNKESIPVCHNAEITGNSYSQPAVKNLTATKTNDNHIELSWDSPYTSDWVTHDGGQFTALYYETKTNKFTVAVRFTEDDLNSFLGSQLTKVRFYLYNTGCSHKIQVWYVDKNHVPEIPVTEQEVISLKTGYNDITLSQPVPVESGKELWIGIYYEMRPLNYVAAIDKGPTVEDRNYLFLEDEWYYVDDSDNLNWCIAGYLDFDDNTSHAPAGNWLRASPSIKYNIYRDNIYLTDLTDTHYVDTSVPDGSHIYCISISNNNQLSEQICVQSASTTGIKTILKGNTVKTYPNPVQKGETLTIELGDDFENTTLSFYSISGQLLKQETASGRIIRKKLDLEPGTYILQIAKGREVSSLKVIIK